MGNILKSEDYKGERIMFSKLDNGNIISFIIKGNNTYFNNNKYLEEEKTATDKWFDDKLMFQLKTDTYYNKSKTYIITTKDRKFMEQFFISKTKHSGFETMKKYINKKYKLLGNYKNSFFIENDELYKFINNIQ